MKWLGLGGAGTILVGGGLLAWQARTPPVTNAYYVALGSSYAAGLGLGPRAPGSPIVSQRTINGYPQHLARLLSVPSFTDMSSSGSTVRHVLHGGQMLLGPQIDALGPDTRLVTLTAGGNDVGYVGDLIAIAYSNRGGVIGGVVGAFWRGAKPISKRPFDDLAMTLRETLHEIQRRSPQARIIVVTYPTILPDGPICASAGITEAQAALMRGVGVKLAATTREAAAAAGATVVDMALLSKGHDACSTDPWINGFRPAAGADFHPTLAGARATAEAIAKAIAV
ncbi:SGNH/GDSL hydrolase family protein [Sphingomonas psychrolutea]|uniref:SGNH/GDSL hydrolase family protein n=1 Tax=Sphingomonas psychrolutea TaxID=1259676 RepID=UPI001663C1D7|nr:SGNH/GDSL hydrolase family protein [Sphingomonas psychrolutea]